MGILSGLVNVLLKYWSKYPTIKNNVVKENIQRPPLFDQSLYIPQSLFFLLNQSDGGKINGKAIVNNVNEIVGVDI